MVEGVERVVERQGDGEEVVWVGMKGLLGGLVGAKVSFFFFVIVVKVETDIYVGLMYRIYVYHHP